MNGEVGGLTLESELEFACQIAVEAGRGVLSRFEAGDVGTRSKGEKDVVTAADVASEKLMRERLQETFPDDGIVAEEGTNVRRDNNRRWFLDPLDGTLNYSRGIPIWCLSVSLFDRDEPILGVVHDPIRGEVFAAARGLGASCNGRSISCSHVSDPSSAVVHLGIDFRDENMLFGLEDIAAVTPGILRMRNTGAVALALAYVAAGRIDAVIHRFANTWDYGGGVMLVKEAAGVVSDMDGSPYRDVTEAVLASAGHGLHSGLLSLLKGSSAKPAT